MNETGLEYRGLDDVCFEMIEKDSALKKLLERVRQDPDCRIEVRHNYLNCYYRCGSMFKLTFNTGRRTLTFTFDPKYLELKEQRNVPPGLDTWLKAKYKCPDKWADKRGDLKLVMEAWFEENNKQEKTMQQKLAEQNSFAKGNSLHVIDIELAIPQHQELGRMDMIAVRREETGEGTKYIPVIVELKNGTKAFRGKSGILEHYEKTIDFLKNHNGDDFLRETIRRIWCSKRKLKLMDEPVLERLEDAELMFAVTDWNGTPEDIRERYLAKIDELERPVWAAIFPKREYDYDLGKSGVLLPQHKKGNWAMATLTIYRGTHNIGGCCTEISCGGERILIDLGSNLPDSDALIRDDELLEKVFDGRPAAGLLFTHPHGDHYGLYKKAPRDVPMYIGPMAKDILKILVRRLDYISDEKGLPTVDRMQTYLAGKELGAFQNIRVTPLYVDHSAPDAYMFYIETAGKKILYSGDFRDHGIVGERDRLWRTLEKYVPQNIDLLITEGTMLSRRGETAANSVRTEEELGRRAEELFGRHKYNFVLVSSTNLDSIMEFYHHTPKGMYFVCDAYQAEVMLTAMAGMERRGVFPRYQRAPNHSFIHVVKGGSQLKRLKDLGALLKLPVSVVQANDAKLEERGFVMLVRKNSDTGKESVFEEKLNKFYPLDGQIIYSMWSGYLGGKHADQALLRFIDGRPIEQLHTSGHAYVETIARLIETVKPKTIVPMHTERADEFASIPEFAPYKDQVQVLKDGEALSLDAL